ncbi:MAG TPA: TetR/AcrR family transcriptional regulator [Pseudonocardiaceae bacterium]|nr:TetR/AcrR family transcriptional regulator [Pseudonocardiaceae bacterium]
MGTRRGRPPVSQQHLDTDAIIAAGLEVLDEVGLDALTMSRVADRLQVKAASLYWHVRDKEHLLDLLADALAGSIDLGMFADPTDWRASLAAMLRAMRRQLLAHRDAARVMHGRFGTGPGQLHGIEVMLTLLRGAGFDKRATAYALFMATTFLIGFVTGERGQLSASVAEGQPRRDYLGELRERFATLPAEEYPTTVDLAVELTEPDLDSRFEFALTCLLDGFDRLDGRR